MASSADAHSPKPAPSAANGYVLATLGVAAATLIRLLLEPWLQGHSPYPLYYLVILGVAWFYGPGPTILATVLSLVAAWYFILPPRFSLILQDTASVASLLLHVVMSTALVILARAARAARAHSEVSQSELEARRAEAAGAYELRNRLAAIVESSNDAIISKNLDGIIQSWNAGAERILGYKAEEIVGQSILRLIPPDRQQEETAILSRIRRGERVEHFDTFRMTKDGRLVELSLTVSPVKDSQGKVIGASKVARDITERRRAERAVAEQREWFRVTLASIGDGVITTDKAARVTYMNEVASHLTGWSAKEAEGKALPEIFAIEDETTGSRAADPCQRVLETRQVVELANHTNLVARDGSRTAIADSAAPIIDGVGEVIGVVLVFHDASERRRVETERQTAARDREQLLESERAARTEAERASRLKDEFVATLSHELRTPLTAILGWAQMLRRKAEDPDAVRRGMEVIERNTRLQGQLISDLLDMSRIVSGKLRLEIQACDMGALVDAALETVRPAADAKNIVIERQLEGVVEPLAADSARLQQVIWNLLSNAIKFTNEGGRVRVTAVQDAGGVELTVEDTGIGINPEFLPHLFARFRQADASSSRRFGGLGLGLAIVKELVELHGGTVTASSAGEGQGARFVVRLPAGRAASALRPAGATPPMGIRVQAGSLVGVRVLLVEDEPDTRDFLRQLLRESGLQVTAVGSAKEGIEALRQDRPDIILSDISMPGEDGYAFIQRVRALEGDGQSHPPAIALTAFAREEDRTRALQAGFQAHVSKPVDGAALMSAMSDLVRKQSAERLD